MITNTVSISVLEYTKKILTIFESSEISQTPSLSFVSLAESDIVLCKSM